MLNGKVHKEVALEPLHLKAGDSIIMLNKYFPEFKTTAEVIYEIQFQLAEDDKFTFNDLDLDIDPSCGSESCEAY